MLRTGAMLSMLGFVACMSRWLAPDDFGVLALLVSLVTLAAGLGSFGQSEMAIRTLAASRQRGEEAAAERVTSEVAGLVVPVSGAVGGCLASWLAWSGQPPGVWIAALVLTVSLSLMAALAGPARMAGRYVLALAPKDIAWRLLAIAVVGGLVVTGLRPALATVAMVTALAAMLSAAWQARRLGVAAMSMVRPDVRVLEKPYLRASGMLAVSTLAIVAMSTVDVIAVGSLVSPAAAATYFPANRLAFLAAFAVLPIQLVIEQRFAAELVAGDTAALQRTANVATALLFPVSLVLATMVLAGFPFYRVLFPTAGELTWQLLAILVGGIVLGSLLSVSEPLMIQSGHQDRYARTNIVVAGGAIPLTGLAAASGNLLAVAGVIAGCEVLRKALIAHAAWRLTGIAPLARMRL